MNNEISFSLSDKLGIIGRRFIGRYLRPLDYYREPVHLGHVTTDRSTGEYVFYGPEELVGASDQVVIAHVRSRTSKFRSAVNAARVEEIGDERGRSGKVDEFRRANYYYESASTFQEVEDGIFSRVAFERLKKAMYGRSFAESPGDSWNPARGLSIYIDNAIKTSFPKLKYIVDCRAKSYFSTWAKTVEQNKDFDEIYDLIGVRVTVSDDQMVYAVQQVVQEQFPLIEPHPFKRRIQSVHTPVRDFLSEPKQSGYAAIHINPYYERDPHNEDMLYGFNDLTKFEVQITSYDAMRKLYKGNDRYKVS